jgi:tRNA nucleotidyltransferase (CCA-adding enzyme)
MPSLIPQESVTVALQNAYPELAAVAAAAGGSAFLVGGAVRDLLLGRERGDLDIAVIGDPAALAAKLGAETVAEHERFGTVKVNLDGHEIDLATARIEVYAHPGALPSVAPAHSIEADLARRDFTLNAIGLPLADPASLVDPNGGRADLEAGLLRVLHPDSFVDDPTRAIRAARYAARFGFELEPATAQLLRATDLDTVSAERREAELLRLAGEESAPRGFQLLEEWGLLRLRWRGAELAAAVLRLLSTPLWEGEVEPARAVLAAAFGPVGPETGLAVETPRRPSEAVALARPLDLATLAIARALGADWLDDYVSIWRDVSLAIDGEDLIAAGVPAGPAIGRGLDAALRAKLDGEVGGREQELEVALVAARGG